MTDSELEHYITSFRKNVFNTAFCYVKNASDADDITQNVFVKLCTYGKAFNSDEHAKAWLIRCAVNESKNLLRSHWYRFSLPLEAVGETPAGMTEESVLLGIMNRLGKKNRTALYMYYYEGYSQEEIAKLLEAERNELSDGLQRFF